MNTIFGNTNKINTIFGNTNKMKMNYSNKLKHVTKYKSMKTLTSKKITRRKYIKFGKTIKIKNKK